jgi:hypothetical protein
VKHATDAALDQLEDLLEHVRVLPGVVETKRGLFHRDGAAFLHFHEDGAGLFADARVTDDWRRFRVSTQTERRAFLHELRRFLRA